SSRTRSTTRPGQRSGPGTGVRSSAQTRIKLLMNAYPEFRGPPDVAFAVDIGSAGHRLTLRLVTPSLLLGVTVLTVAGCRHAQAVSANDRASFRATARADAPIARDPAPTAAPRREPVVVVQGSSTIQFREVDQSAGIGFTHQSGNSPEKYYPTGNGSG